MDDADIIEMLLPGNFGRDDCMIRLVQIMAIVLALLAAQPSYSSDDIQQKLDRAKKLIDAGKPQPAKLLLRELIRQSPRNAEAHMQLGAALASLAQNDQYDEAIAEEKKAIDLDAKSFGARRILGMIYANQRKYDESIALLRESAELNPSSFAVHRDLGSACLSAGKIDDAIVALKRASALNPTNVATHLRLANIFSKQGKFADAISESEQAAKVDDSKAEAHLALANAKLASGDAAGSIESFNAAIAANGFDSFGSKNPVTAAGALSGLGWALATSKVPNADTLKEAVSYQRKAMKADPHFLPAYIRLAQLLEQQNKPKEAEVMYKRIFAATHFDPSVGVPFARFLSNAKRTDDARDVLQKILEKHPGNKQVSDALSAL